MPKKNPWIAAVLNFILWGLGYLYIRNKIVFGALFLIADIIISFASILNLDLLDIPVFAGFFLISIALACDGYVEAKRLNKRKS